MDDIIKTNKMNYRIGSKVILFLLLFFLSTFALKLHSQVSAGSVQPPEKGFVLQIKNKEPNLSAGDNSTVDANGGGLGLSRVFLKNMKTLEPFIAKTADWDNVTPSQETANIKMKHAGLTVYNIYSWKEDPTNDNNNNIPNTDTKFQKGVYVWDGEQWALVGQSGQRYFYMPAFNLPLNQLGDTTFDLYEEYRWQFTKDRAPYTDKPLFATNETNLATVPSPDIGYLYQRGELDYAVIYYDNNIIEITGLDNNGVMSYKVLDMDPGPESFMNVVFIVKD
ncbi:MAG: hypothetical protein LBV43_10645 [Prevotella sp.]|jgi:hypothetical protein|nr:hypothetical protein [Prevotella sp.]